jgi:hypothetical protein
MGNPCKDDIESFSFRKRFHLPKILPYVRMRVGGGGGERERDSFGHQKKPVSNDSLRRRQEGQWHLGF